MAFGPYPDGLPHLTWLPMAHRHIALLLSPEAGISSVAPGAVKKLSQVDGDSPSKETKEHVFS